MSDMWCIFHVVTPRILDAGGCETPAIFAAAVRTIISGRRLDELQFLWFFVALAFFKIVVDKSLSAWYSSFSPLRRYRETDKANIQANLCCHLP